MRVLHFAFSIQITKPHHHHCTARLYVCLVLRNQSRNIRFIFHYSAWLARDDLNWQLLADINDTNKKLLPYDVVQLICFKLKACMWYFSYSWPLGLIYNMFTLLWQWSTKCIYRPYIVHSRSKSLLKLIVWQRFVSVGGGSWHVN